MAVKYAVFDWNGTLFEPPTDEGLNKAIAYAVLDDAKRAVKHGRIWRVADIAKLLVAKSQISSRLEEYKRGERPLAEVYEPFNRLVIDGTPLGVVYDAMDSYAKENADKVDMRILEPLKEFRRDLRNKTGILSVSQRTVIEKVLYIYHSLQMDFSLIPFQNMVCNNLEISEADGCYTKGMTLGIHGKKPETFEEEFLRKRKFNAQETIYAGDTEDDLSVAELIPRGHFVVPFYAMDDFRQHAAGKYGAFVPEDEAGFRDYLLKS